MTVTHLCGQALCMNEAACSFVYPGRPRAMLCAVHLPKLLELAAGLGLSVASLDIRSCADMASEQEAP